MLELGEDVYEADEPRGVFFDENDVRKYANLKDAKVIVNGCTLGEEKLAKAFLDCGCHSHLGPDDYIDGNSGLMFVMRFIYEIINNKKSDKEAYEIAKAIDGETGMYQMYLSKP